MMELKKQYDFSKGERGKFYNPDAIFNVPVYLDPDANDYMSKLAEKKNIDVQALVNEWLRANIRVIESIQ
jgi:hypothetical protein